METNQSPSSARSYWLGKIFSFVGIVPIGVYVMIHLYNNLRSLSGEASFNGFYTTQRATPLIVPIMILVIWIPIAFHGIYGLFVMKRARPNFGAFPYFRNFKYLIQRLSGLGLLLFIPAHIYKTRIEPGIWNSTLDFKHMVEGLHEPLTLVIYLLGVLGVAYHLANGIWQFSIGWGVVTSERGMRRMESLSYFVFLILLTMGYAAIWGFYRSA